MSISNVRHYAWSPSIVRRAKAAQCLSALAEIEEKRLLNKDEVAYLRQLALEVREELVTQIAGFRDSWRERYGLG